MNISQRLKKIETGLNLDSDFCRCEREIVIKVKPRNKNGELPEPEICGDCGKPIDRFHFTFTFNRNVETRVIYPSYQANEPGDEPAEGANQQ